MVDSFTVTRILRPRHHSLPTVKAKVARLITAAAIATTSDHASSELEPELAAAVTLSI